MFALLSVTFHLFQSTPAIADGRTVVAADNDTDTEGFNPRPPSLTGERAVTMPSIKVLMFQSTPAIADGRTCWRSGCATLPRVSIHARHR